MQLQARFANPHRIYLAHGIIHDATRRYTWEAGLCFNALKARSGLLERLCVIGWVRMERLWKHVVHKWPIY